MHTNAINGTTSAPVAIDPTHPAQAFHEGSFRRGDGAFVVLYGVNSGRVTGSFLQRFAAFGAAIQFSSNLANAGPGTGAQITPIDGTHFGTDMQTAANLIL